MKKINTLLFFILSVTSFGQVNLVPNPSFEEYSQCPELNSDISWAVGWTNPTGYSPDYFNACVSINDGYGVPLNYVGFETAKSGNGYAGFFTMRSGNWREYIQAELTLPLVQGKRYCVEFYISGADSSLYLSNDIGAYLSVNQLSEETMENLHFLPQVENDAATNPLSNIIGWTKVSGSFIANGGERFLILGNFKPDNLTDTTVMMTIGWQDYSYHYIDDVSVYECNDLSINVNEYNNVSFYPNPFNYIINVNIVEETTKICIFDTYGNTIKTIHKNEFIGKSLIEIQLNDFPKGIYFLEIELNNKSMINKLLKL